MLERVRTLWIKLRTISGSIVMVTGVAAAAIPQAAAIVAAALADISASTPLELNAVAEDIVQYAGTAAGIVAAVSVAVARVTRVPRELEGLIPIDLTVTTTT